VVQRGAYLSSHRKLSKHCKICKEKGLFYICVQFAREGERERERDRERGRGILSLWSMESVDEKESDDAPWRDGSKVLLSNYSGTRGMRWL